MNVAPRSSVIARDLRALGIIAPVRAAYEASKRLGGHALVFGHLDKSRHAVPRDVYCLPPVLPTAARQRSIAEAQTLTRGVTPIFGVNITSVDDWHWAPDTGGRWAQAPWWKVDIRSEDRLADVKWTWELGRHRHLLVLARAAWLEPDDAAYLDSLVAGLRSWLTANPPEHGVHWYSNLEIALRALVWLQVLGLVADRLPDDVRTGMHHHLAHSGRHLIVDLPYTISSMRNNHMLGDALGLIALGKAFSRPRWEAIGNRLFDGQLARHMRSDGSMIEDSLSYHRFVTEMLAMRMLLSEAPDAVVTALRTSGEYLARLGVFEGSLPQYGDWDEGRVLGSSGDPLAVAGCAALALSLTGTGASKQWRADYDECAWYAGQGQPAPVPEAVQSGEAVGGGFARAVQGDWTVFLKAGGGTSHQHADLCSTTVSWRDQWIIGDPGTGTYNGPLEQRNAFRTSGAHSVLRLDGSDQLVPHRAFRWLHPATGAVGAPLDLPGATVVWGAHDAYRRLDGLGRLVRVVVLSEHGLVVADVVENGVGHGWELTLPLHPDVTAEPDGVQLPDGAQLAFAVPGKVRDVHGADEPYAGWWSDTYGSARPTTWRLASGRVEGPIIWSLGSVPDVKVLPDGLCVGGRDLRVSFLDSCVTLTAHLPDGPQVLYARLGA